ncbi:nicotinamide N-methyltransferase-like isoform X1 [Lineus longissimus]|uniref:nicotinamide N-methyltransferase-like isoform X1 n=1 Tax=Lineus longissimus TaxID=88925 RepID=UPI00315C927E
MANDPASESFETAILSGVDYKTHFDTKIFLDNYHTKESRFYDKMSEMLHELMAAAEIRDGSRLLDVGSGPSIYSVISAGSRCSDIVCSDYVTQNLDEILKWVNGDPDAHNCQRYFEYVCKLEGKSDDWKLRQDHIRQAIKRVVPCDVHQENPLAPLVLEPFDVISSSLCLEVACCDESSYRSAVKHVTSLLKPGGILFVVGIQGETFYSVGNKRFKAFPLSNEIIESAYAEVGLTNLRWCNETCDSKKYPFEGLPYDMSGLFGVSATRTDVTASA